MNEPRAILNGILWILRTGAPWKDLPERYPPYQTCHRWFQRWRKEGVFDTVLLALADDLRERGKLDLREAFIDGTFAPAKKGAVPLVKPNVANASPHEVILVEYTLDRTLNELPGRLIGGKACDSDKLDARLEEAWGIEMIAPTRKKRAKTQDGRPLRRYRRRWKVERLFAWLHNFRRLVARYEFHLGYAHYDKHFNVLK